MATIQVLSPTAIAGLHRPPTAEDLELSRDVYNSLPHPEEQPDVTHTMLMALGELFVRHNVQDSFGIHLLHGHFTAPEGTVLLGTQFQVSDASQGCWTKPVPVNEIGTKPIRGHVFRLRSDGIFFPYEFEEGEVDDKTASATPAFFQELASYLHSTDLADLIALQLLDGPLDKTEMEFEVGPQGTVMLKEQDIINTTHERITTGWSFKVGDDGIISCRGNAIYSPTAKKTHRVFLDSKLLPTPESLNEALRAYGIVA